MLEKRKEERGKSSEGFSLLSSLFSSGLFSSSFFLFSLSSFLLLSCQDKFDKEETHKHAPIFSGMVRSTPEHKHIELYIQRSGAIEVYLFDEAQDIVETQGATGTIEIT